MWGKRAERSKWGSWTKPQNPQGIRGSWGKRKNLNSAPSMKTNTSINIQGMSEKGINNQDVFLEKERAHDKQQGTSRSNHQVKKKGRVGNKVNKQILRGMWGKREKASVGKIGKGYNQPLRGMWGKRNKQKIGKERISNNQRLRGIWGKRDDHKKIKTRIGKVKIISPQRLQGMWGKRAKNAKVIQAIMSRSNVGKQGIRGMWGKRSGQEGEERALLIIRLKMRNSEIYITYKSPVCNVIILFLAQL